MRIIPRKFQDGGAVDAPQEEPVDQAPAEEAAAPEEQAPQGQEDPMMQIVQMFAEGLQKQDCQLLAQGAQMFLQLVQQQQGGAAPQEEQGQPVFKKGGILVRRIKK